jgi:hypothetical protein
MRVDVVSRRRRGSIVGCWRVSRQAREKGKKI